MKYIKFSILIDTKKENINKATAAPAWTLVAGYSTKKYETAHMHRKKYCIIYPVNML